MGSFDEAWLAAYKLRLAGAKSAARLPDRIEFSVPRLLALPNVTGGQHWTLAVRRRTILAPLVGEALRPWLGCIPMQRARVTVTRYSTGDVRPDTDNAFASLKPLIDLLLVRDKTHPHSFGLIEGDAPHQIFPIALAVRCSTKKDQRTEVVIERLSASRTGG